MPKQDSEKLITREEFEKVKKLLEARATKLSACKPKHVFYL
jgi:hypothetical protein